MSVKKRPCSITFTDKSRTLQDPAKECDLSYMIKKFHKEYGVNLEDVYKNFQGGMYGDFSGVTSYQDALDQVAQAQESFMELPAQVRLTFDNDPGKFLEFVQDPSNFDKLVEMGLAEKPKDDGKSDQIVSEPPKV